MPRQKRRLDTVVKLGLGVFIGSFALIWGGMFLTRPDRSIPPFSIGAQEGDVVAVHVPMYTADASLETLIRRFGRIARTSRDFGRMKIQPTTPADPGGRYQRMTVYVFTHEAWAEPEMLRRYLAARRSSMSEDKALRDAFENAVRGFYSVNGGEDEGRIGPMGQPASGQPSATDYSKMLFKGAVTSTLPRAAGEAPGP